MYDDLDDKVPDWRLLLGWVLWIIGLFFLMFAVQQRDDLKYGGYDGPLSDYLLSLADAVILSAFGVIFCISGSIAFAVHSLKKNTITYT